MDFEFGRIARAVDCDIAAKAGAGASAKDMLELAFSLLADRLSAETNLRTVSFGVQTEAGWQIMVSVEKAKGV